LNTSPVGCLRLPRSDFAAGYFRVGARSPDASACSLPVTGSGIPQPVDWTTSLRESCPVFHTAGATPHLLAVRDEKQAGECGVHPPGFEPGTSGHRTVDALAAVGRSRNLVTGYGPASFAISSSDANRRFSGAGETVGPLPPPSRMRDSLPHVDPRRSRRELLRKEFDYPASVTRCCSLTAGECRVSRCPCDEYYPPGPVEPMPTRCLPV